MGIRRMRRRRLGRELTLLARTANVIANVLRDENLGKATQTDRSLG